MRRCFSWRHSEKMDVIDGQISLFFNEPEAEAATQAVEPEFKEVVRRKKRVKGKREEDFKGIPVAVKDWSKSVTIIQVCSNFV